MSIKKILDEQYEIVSELKRGGFATVYYGIDRNLGKPVALKEIHPELLQEAKYIDLFQAEAQNAAQLSHQNIAHIYELRRAQDGQFYLIMEYVDGVDLASLLRRGKKVGQPLPLEVSCFIIAEVCKALDYAYNRRDIFTNQPLLLVHQDISPSNIMISVEGQVKLIDFGIAKIRFQQMSESKEGVVVQGKLPYLAPEQLKNPSGPDRRSDIYSLGVVFFELLTGTRLYNQTQVEDLVTAIRRGRPTLDPLQEKNIPGEVQKIVMKAINSDIERRYQSAYHMNLDLTDYLTNTNGTTEYNTELGEYIRTLFFDDKSNGNGVNPRVMEETQTFAAAMPSEAAQVINEFDSQTQPPTDYNESLPSLDSFEDIGDFAPIKENTRISQTPDASDSYSSRSETPEKLIQQPKPIVQEKDIYSGIEEVEAEPVSNETFRIRTPIIVTDIEGEEEVGEDEMKTIIDVVRLQAKTHKKAIIGSLAGIIAAFIVFTVLDIFLKITSYGQTIYDIISPPAIRVVSVPPGAEVFLNNEPLALKTPASVRRILPGVHKLSLKLAGYRVIEKSIQVPPKGKPTVAGMNSPPRRDPYLFRFESEIEFNTMPPGATVFLNGSPFTETTPCRVPWKVGMPLEVEIKKEGFSDIKGFSVNLLDEVEQIDDRRVWNFRKVKENEKYYIVEATFKKVVRINSIPDRVEVYVDNDPNVVGLTGVDSQILLPMGRHEIMLKKEDFISKRIYLDVTENSSGEINEILYRNVRFFAKDVTDPGDNELGARLVELIRNGQVTRRDDRTPCEISLPPYNYEVLVQKPGYKDIYVSVTPTTNVVVARMEPLDMYIEINVVDALSGAPIQGAQVSYIAPSSDASEKYLGQTDQAGRVGRDLPPGRYTFRTKKFGYQEGIKNFSTKLRGSNIINFRLILQ